MQISSEEQSITQRLNQLKSSIKQCILNKSFITPLFNFHKEFSFDTLKYEYYPKSRLSINLNTIGGMTRLLQIVQVVLMLAQKREFITKRNLYYKLIHYYKVYAAVDGDIELLALNLNAVREDLHIISSSRCILLGNVTFTLNQNSVVCTSKMITNIMSYRSIGNIVTKCKNLFIIEKESAMIQIYQQLLNSFITNQEPLWFEQSIFLTSKGYPDNTCRGIVSHLCPMVENLYYLGDEDIYGVDILLCYAIGMNNYSTILHRINWIDLTAMIDPLLLDPEYEVLSKEDKKKYIEICNRNYFKDIEDFIPKGINEIRFKQKAIAWKNRLTVIKTENKKIQLQSFFKFLKADWIETMIDEKRYL